MTSIYAIISLISSIIILMLGEFIFLLDRRNALNRAFALFTFFLSGWAFIEFMYRQSQNAIVAEKWLRIVAFFWPYPTALFLLFTLIFTESKQALRSWVTYIVLFIPAITITILDFSTHRITGFPIKEYWGFTFLVPRNILYFALANLWQFILVITSIVIILRFYARTTNLKKKQQAKYIALGFSFPAMASLISGALLPALGIKFPEILTLFMTILVIFVGYAISKYELFTISPTSAAENIVSTMTDSMILINPKGTILNANKSTLDLLHYQEGELFGRSAKVLFSDKELFDNLLMKSIKQEKLVKNIELRYCTKEDTPAFVLFSTSLIKDKRNKTVGIVGIGKDITDRKRAEEALKKAEVRQVYVDVFSAVTGDKLIIMTKDELEKTLGNPLIERHNITEYKQLGEARRIIRNTLNDYFPSFKNVDDMLVASAEALTNAVKHARGGFYQIFETNNTTQILIADNGPGIDFKSLPKATLLSGYSTKQTLGVGFNIMLEYSDRILISTEAGRTEIVLEIKSKKLEAQKQIKEMSIK